MNNGKTNGKSKEKLPDRPPAFESLTNLACELGTCYRTVHRAAQENKIPTIRIGGRRKVPRAEYERILKEGF